METTQPLSTQTTDNIFTDDLIKKLEALSIKTGVPYSKIEEDFRVNFNNTDAKLPLHMRRSYTLMVVRAETSNLADNPLTDYEMRTKRWKTMNEQIVTAIDESMIVDVTGALYLKFPLKFKEEFDVKTAFPILATMERQDRITKLSYVFSNDTLKIKTKK